MRNRIALDCRPIVVTKARTLKRLLQPRSIAIVGISAEAGSIGAAVLANLERFGFSGDIHLVSRRHPTIGAHETVGSIDALPQGIDVAVLAVPAAAIGEAIKNCVQRDIGAAVIYASGFAEIGEPGRIVQDELTQYAQAGAIAVNGPNCIGLANLCDGVPLTYEPLTPMKLEGRPSIGVLTQSGAMASSLRNALVQKQLDISYVVSTGNEAVSGIEDFLEFIIEDGRTDVIAIFAEQIRRPRRFLESASKARSIGKHIVMLHPGRSARARDSALSHTGALAGDHAVMSAQVAHHGVVLVDTIEELLDSAELLARFPSPPGGGLAVMTNSGAFKGLTLDLCEQNDIPLASLESGTRSRLSSVLPSFATVENPLDVTGQVIKEPQILANAAVPLLDDPTVGSLLISFVPGGPSQATDKAKVLLPVLSKSKKPVTIAVMGDEVALPSGYAETLRNANIPFLRSPERALRALAHSTRHAHRRARFAEPPTPITPVAVELPSAGTMPEYLSKRVLARIGIPSPRGGLARDVGEACRIAAEIGYPVALKAQAAALPHKSDVGGVILGVSSEDALCEQWEHLSASIQQAKPGLVPDGILVEVMGDAGLEFMLGAKRDPDWGAVLLVGLGGIWVEALHDVRVLPVSLSPVEIREQLTKLRAGALLGALRGKPPRDEQALVDAIRRVGALMQHNCRIAEIDINPLAVGYEGKGVLALDALITVGSDDHEACHGL
jgi:acetate---CoA ligase (ADP-forming)